MPLNDATAQIVAQQIVQALNVPSKEQSTAVSNWKAIVAAIFSGITQNAIVVPTTEGAPTLIAPPGPAGGPVTGVGSIE